MKFSDIGRKCFAWALRQAWVEARDAARIVAVSPAIKAERIETLQTLIAHAGFIDSCPQWKASDLLPAGSEVADSRRTHSRPRFGGVFLCLYLGLIRNHPPKAASYWLFGFRSL
jgi:hypothetical protein